MNIVIAPPTRTISLLTSFEKGRLFEAYIIQLFNEQSFKLKVWHEAKDFGSIDLPRGYGDPDLEMVYMGSRKYKFAIECKWRRKLDGDQIEWAKTHQIKTYRNFYNKSRLPVFIAIGIGGHPSAPEKLFVTPLSNICDSPIIREKDLIRYERKPTRKFFFDTIQTKLF